MKNNFNLLKLYKYVHLVEDSNQAIIDQEDFILDSSVTWFLASI